jgi:hypothetical protein
MSAPPTHERTASCACGSVEIQAIGAPIATAACYCDDCQEASRQLEALPNGRPVQDPDGGTAYVVYRKDRVSCSKGAALLKPHKIRARSTTNRVLATCCNSVMLLTFDDAKHWVDVYRSRFSGEAPPLQLRMCTKFKPAHADLPDDVPRHAGYPFTFLVKLLVARVAMLLHR